MPKIYNKRGQGGRLRAGLGHSDQLLEGFAPAQLRVSFPSLQRARQPAVHVKYGTLNVCGTFTRQEGDGVGNLVRTSKARDAGIKYVRPSDSLCSIC
jgi:hypothetical protein